MNIGVIGLGAVGMFVAAELSKHHEVTGYARRHEQIEKIHINGIQYGGKKLKVKVSHINEISEHDLYIVCVKQTQLDDCLIYLNRIKKKALVLFLQNGLGHLEKIESLPHHIFVGTNEYGILKKSDYEVKLTGKGQIQFRKLDDDHRHLEDKLVHELSTKEFVLNKSDQLLNILHEKLIINSVINPLTAIFEVKNGFVIENDYLKKIAYQLTEEACEVLAMDEKKMWERVKTVCLNTKENYSSMVVDIQNNRQTEIDYINGYLLNKSEQALTHQLIYNLIKGKESLARDNT